MDIHKNARLTPILREELANKVLSQAVPSGSGVIGNKGVLACRIDRPALCTRLVVARSSR
jgi:hypothetical protein